MTSRGWFWKEFYEVKIELIKVCYAGTAKQCAKEKCIAIHRYRMK